MVQTVKRLPTMQEAWVEKIPWRRKWQPTPILLPGKSHGQRSLVSYSPRGHKELGMTERRHFLSMHTHKCIKQTLTDLRGEKKSNTKIVEDSNTTLLSTGRLSTPKIKKETLDLNDI